MAAWVYYLRYMQHQADGYDTLLEAMRAADFMSADLQGSVEAVVDADGTAYTIEQAWAWLKEHDPKKPAPPPPPAEPDEYREWRGQRWLVVNDWTSDPEEEERD